MASEETVRSLETVKKNLICNLSLLKRICARELEDTGIPYMGCRPVMGEDKDEADLMYLLDDIAKIAENIKVEAEFMR